MISKNSCLVMQKLVKIFINNLIDHLSVYQDKLTKYFTITLE